MKNFNTLMILIKEGVIDDDKVIDRIFEEENSDINNPLWEEYAELKSNQYLSDLMGSNVAATDKDKICAAFDIVEDESDGTDHVNCNFINTTYLRNARKANEQEEAVFRTKEDLAQYCNNDKVVKYLISEYRITALTKAIVDEVLCKLI